MRLMAEEDRVLILLGPTGVGKTGVSIVIAKSIDTEIIGADSMQLYRGMDIGTAKPTPRQLKEVRHHMIDIIDPSESYSAGRYLQNVRAIIQRLHEQGRIPLVVGGTGLYIRALTKGLFEAPEANPSLRAELMEMQRRSPGILYEELRRVDPERASQINPHDIRRIVRALEVVLTARRPMSELQKTLTRPLPYRFIKIGLTRDRKELYRLIEKRVDEMFEKGLVEEVKRLLKRNPSEVPLQAIGYKEVIKYIKGDATLEETVRAVKKATKAYAKRQFTWFRKEPEIQWVDITGLYDSMEIFNKLCRETILGRLIEEKSKK